MWISYVRSALRSLRKYRTNTLVNGVGLAICLAVALLLILFVRSQWQTDRFHPEADRLVRITMTDSERGARYATTPAPLAATLEADASVERAVTLARFGRTVETDAGAFGVRGLYASPALFEMFGLTLQAGRASTALAAPDRVVVSESTARRLFGEDRPIGRTVDLGNGRLATVTGVLAPTDGPTHLPLDVIVSLDTYTQQVDGVWTDWGQRFQTYTYARLSGDRGASGLQAHLRTVEQRIEAGASVPLAFGVQSVPGIGVGDHLWNEIAQNVLPRGMGITFLVLALVVIAAAVFNYVNLSTARAAQRAQEVGIRKALGAGRLQLVGQFLAEALWVTTASMILACVLLGGLVPWFNGSYIVQFAGTDLSLDVLRDPGLLAVLAGITVLVALFAGSYPAVRLSAPVPAVTLRASGTVTGGRSNRLRNVLVGTQVAFTFLFAVTAVFTYQQSAFLLDSDHGFDSDRLLTVSLDDVDAEPFRRQVEARPDVEHVSFSSLIPLSSSYGGGRLYVDGAGDRDSVRVDDYAVDSSFVREMGLRTGYALPNASSLFRSKQGLWLNRVAAQTLGFQESNAAVGQTVTFRASRSDRGSSYTVAGLLDDVHFAPKINEIRPMIVRPAEGSPRYALVRASTDDLGGVLAGLQSTWSVFATDAPFRGETFQEAMSPVHTIMAEAARIVLGMTLLAILIACVGLLGLAALTVSRRTAEIGIRKALGASMTQILELVSKEYVVLVSVAVVVATPIAWLLTQQWLRLFAYRVDLGLVPFLACAAVLMTLSLATVGTQAWRAARVDPARSLRDE